MKNSGGSNFFRFPEAGENQQNGGGDGANAGFGDTADDSLYD